MGGLEPNDCDVLIMQTTKESLYFLKGVRIQSSSGVIRGEAGWLIA
jgi:hypothetical protein